MRQRASGRSSGGTLLRTIGVALLGLIGGVLFAIIAQDVLARVLLADHAGSKARALLGLVLPACGVTGAALAVRLDRRGRSPGRAPRRR